MPAVALADLVGTALVGAHSYIVRSVDGSIDILRGHGQVEGGQVDVGILQVRCGGQHHNCFFYKIAVQIFVPQPPKSATEKTRSHSISEEMMNRPAWQRPNGRVPAPDVFGIKHRTRQRRRQQYVPWHGRLQKDLRSGNLYSEEKPFRRLKFSLSDSNFW